MQNGYCRGVRRGRGIGKVIKFFVALWTVIAISIGVGLINAEPSNAESILTPTYASLIRISGWNFIGQTLTVEEEAWPEGTSFSYQWSRGGAPIPQATARTYVATTEDVHNSISVEVTGSKTGFDPVTKWHTFTSYVKDGFRVGDYLVGDQPIPSGGWEAELRLSDPHVIWQWYRSGQLITGANERVYTATESDQGFTLSVGGSWTRADGTVFTFRSQESPIVFGSTAPYPTIQGNSVVGSTLTASPGIWSDGVELSYQWLANGEWIPGATGLAFTIGPSELGKSISFMTIGHAGITEVPRTAMAPQLVQPNSMQTQAGMNFGAQVSGPGTCALQLTGTIFCSNPDVPNTPPVKIVGIEAAVSFDGSWFGGCAVISTGQVRCWGLNYYGQLGNGTKVASQGSVAVSGISNAISISSTSDLRCATLADGSVSCWGKGRIFPYRSEDTSTVPVKIILDDGAVSAVLDQSTRSICVMWVDQTISCEYPNQNSDRISVKKRVASALRAKPGTLSLSYGKLCAINSDGRYFCRDAVGGVAYPEFGAKVRLVGSDCVVLESNEMWCTSQNGFVLQPTLSQKVIYLSRFASNEYGFCVILEDFSFVCRPYGTAQTPLVVPQGFGLPIALAPTPSITGTAVVGSQIAVAPGQWDEGVTLAHQWLRSGTPIPEATGQTYALTNDDAGESIAVRVTGTRFGFAGQTRTSQPTEIVTGGVFASFPAPVITGEAKTDSEILATMSGWGTGTTFAFQWLRDGQPIEGAVGSGGSVSGYRVTSTDVGHSISVRVTGSKPGFESKTVTSSSVVATTATEPTIALVNMASTANGFTADTGYISNCPYRFRISTDWLDVKVLGNYGQVTKSLENFNVGCRVRIAISGLEAGQIVTVVTKVVPMPGYTSAETRLTGTAAGAGLLPTFSALTSTADGCAGTITNADSRYAFVGNVSDPANGRIQLGSPASGAIPFVVTNLTPGQTANFSITASRESYTSGTNYASCNALSVALTPTISSVTSTSDGFSAVLAGVTSSCTFVATVTTGSASATFNKTTRILLVTNAAPGQSVGVELRSICSGRVDGVITVTGTSIVGPAYQPTLDRAVPTDGGFTFNVTNYNAAYTYSPSVASGTASVGIPSGNILPIVVSGLSSGGSATATVAVTRNGYSSGSGNVYGTALLVVLTPVLSQPAKTATGYSVNITNYDPSYSYAPLVTSGSASITIGTASGSSFPLSVTALSSSPIEIQVTASRSGYAPRSATVILPAAALTPTFSIPVRTVTGFTVNVTNYSAAYTFTPSVSAGSVTAGTVSGSTLPLTVTGLTAGQSVVVTVSTTRTNYATGSSTVTGQALSAALTPVFSTPVRTATGFTVNVTNYNVAYTFTPSMVSGGGTVTKGTVSGSTLPLTVTGLSANASATLQVATSRTGYANGTSTVIGQALPGAAFVSLLFESQLTKARE